MVVFGVAFDFIPVEADPVQGDLLVVPLQGLIRLVQGAEIRTSGTVLRYDLPQTLIVFCHGQNLRMEGKDQGLLFQLERCFLSVLTDKVGGQTVYFDQLCDGKGLSVPVLFLQLSYVGAILRQEEVTIIEKEGVIG